MKRRGRTRTKETHEIKKKKRRKNVLKNGTSLFFKSTLMGRLGADEVGPGGMRDGQSREGKRKGKPFLWKEGYAGGGSSTPWPRGRADLIEPAEPEPPPALFICKVGQGM